MLKRKNKNLFACFGALLVALLIVVFKNDCAFAFSLNITTSGDIVTNVTPVGDGGVGTSIVMDEVNITSNCRSGYTFTITGPSDNNLYLDGDVTNNVSGTYFTPVDGNSALNGAGNINKWGYSLTANTDTGVFMPLSSTGTTLKTPSQTASPNADIDVVIPIYYGAAVNNNLEPGSYAFANQGTITYAVTMDPSCTVYSVQYQGNGADNPDGMGTTNESTGEKSVRQINVSEGTTITLLASNFKKHGYGFLGWSIDENAYLHFVDNDNTNDPIIYGPNEAVTITADVIASATARNQINMYAVWLPALKSDLANPNSTPVYFQDWDNPNTLLPHDGCSTLTATAFDDTMVDERDKTIVTKDSVVALTDKRDNEVYAVAKLVDGKCWMIENLRLNAEYTMGQNQNDSTLTNRDLSQGYGGTTGTYGNFVGLAESEDANFANVTTANSVYKSFSTPSVDTYDPINQTLEDIGIIDQPSRRMPRYNNSNTASSVTNPVYVEDYSVSPNPSVSGNYKALSLVSYGNYYSWAAAMGNTNYYREASASESAGTSICPAGWTLPTGGNDATKDFIGLSQAYGGSTQSGGVLSNRFRRFPNNLVYSGHYNDSTIGYRGASASIWTRTTGPYVVYYFNLSSSGVSSSANNDHKFRGYAIRCNSNDSNVEITLNSNNSSNSVSRVYGVAGESIVLPQSSIAESGYGFKNWNTVLDGSGTAYTTNYTIPADSVGETLYAQWSSQYTITYINNCQSYAGANASCTQSASGSIFLQKINLDTSGSGSGTLKAYNAWTTMSGWKIAGWNTSADGTGTEYRVGSNYSVVNQNPGDGVTLYAHWVPLYSVQYDGNGADNPDGMGTIDANTGLKSVRHYNVGEGDTFDLFASNFRRTGYGFVGWSMDADAWDKFIDNDATNDVRIWGPNEKITAPAYNNTAITTLYAVWAPAEKDASDNPVYLQNWSGCSSMTATLYDSNTGGFDVSKDSITVLTDQRDGNIYAVAKLVDGNCWMMENLRLDDSVELSTTDTNIPLNNSSLPITNIYNADDTLATKSNYLSPSSSVTFDASEAPYGWCSSQDAPCGDQSRLNTTNTVVNSIPSKTQNLISNSTHADFNDAIYGYGNYYNWYSATAGYGIYNKNSGVTAGDICPIGWHLPYGSGGSGTNGGNTSGGYYYLANLMAAASSNAINSNKFRSFPNNYVYSGSWGSGGATSRGGYTYYWSASANSSKGRAYALRLYASGVNPDGSISITKISGDAVRCVISANVGA
ncbi:InlB B-repeat-containing protein [Candidatus Saccharibacteria bacterium]|nr:InlB B-repeat-containing protein [Candidatus Saccharibacteria bacterium]